MEGHEALLEIKDVGFKYGDKAIFSEVALSVRPGDLICISGPSGGGKSTLLHLLNRLQDPDSGTILFDGLPLPDHNVVELRRRICYLQQTPLMVEGTVKENLLLPFEFRASQNSPVADEVLLELLKQFKLSDISLSHDTKNLSVGQKQRLALIRVLLLDPKILLLDEPTSALDLESRTIVEEHIERIIMEERVAALMVTHLDFQPRRLKARKFRLGDGNLTEVL